jgi:hypothetical protein
MTRFTIRCFAFVLGIALLSNAALAAEPGAGAAVDPTPAQRQTMAEIHRKMADCLVSKSPIAECRADMQKNCVAIMGQNGCPMMMGTMGTGGGMMHGARIPASQRK